MTEIKGWHIFTIFALAFGVIIAVNLTLAFNAMRTFPGLEVKNSYIASQSFQVDRAAQMALDWDVNAYLQGDELILSFQSGGAAVAPVIQEAIFGRATMVKADQSPIFVFDGTVFRALVIAGVGNWNLRLRAESEDGTTFQQRVIVQVGP